MAERDLVLVGGGHTHALLIRRLAMKPIPGVRVTLVSEHALTPYSGMLPGLIAGHYSLAETHIDLNRLCQRAGTRFVAARMIALDPEHKCIELENQPPLRYDVVSLDTGSTPDHTLPGAREFAIGVKPVSRFHALWADLLARADTHRETQHWGVIGAGAGGVELVLAMAWRLRHIQTCQFHLIYPGSTILRGSSKGVIRTAQAALRQAGISLHPNFSVSQVTADGVISSDGRTLKLDQTLLCTPAQAPEWPAAAGLDTANGGFVAVRQTLQSCSHDSVFAAGDIAEMVDDPRPKAGVYAVRQAPALHHNLQHWFAGEPLKPVRLQRQFLSLLSLGSQKAVGERNGLAFSGAWVWRWKDRIDRRFMAALNEFKPPPMTADRPGMRSDSAEMHCAGCGSKLGPALLRDTLAELPRHTMAGLVPALDQAEDAMCWTPTPGLTSVQSVDGFRAFSEDLYRLGQVCVQHALSDLFAMNAIPTSAQVWVNLAFNHPRLQQRDFQRLMQGVAVALRDNATALGGGHSTEGAETHLSLTVNGEVDPEQRWLKTGALPGDWLVLTKPLGTGVILAADQAGAAPATAIEAAWQSMLHSNADAMTELRKLNPHAVTDVTGFGLLGHLLEMLDERLHATLWLDRIPALSGANQLLQAGYQSSLTPQLLPYWQHCAFESALTPETAALLIDPQTSGGLLAAVPGKDKDTPPELPPSWLIGQLAAVDSEQPQAGVTIRLE